MIKYIKTFLKEEDMKKLLLIIFSVIILFLLFGCGQEVNVTVYNATGIPVVAGEWIAINIHSENNDNWFLPTTYAKNDTECDKNNSLTIKLKENSTISVGANGKYYDLSQPTPVLTDLTVPVSTATVYGGFPDPPAWYAAVNMKSVLIYKK